jgi:AcrR family transcriptional regulator
MARTTGSSGEKTDAAVREAALSLMARYGYEAVSMRQLAAEIGVQAAALYRYYPTKEDLLQSLLREHMEKLSAGWDEAEPIDGDATERLAAFVRHHVHFPHHAPPLDPCLQHGAAFSVARAADRHPQATHRL